MLRRCDSSDAAAGACAPTALHANGGKPCAACVVCGKMGGFICVYAHRICVYVCVCLPIYPSIYVSYTGACAKRRPHAYITHTYAHRTYQTNTRVLHARTCVCIHAYMRRSRRRTYRPPRASGGPHAHAPHARRGRQRRRCAGLVVVVCVRVSAGAPGCCCVRRGGSKRGVGGGPSVLFVVWVCARVRWMRLVPVLLYCCGRGTKP